MTYLKTFRLFGILIATSFIIKSCAVDRVEKLDDLEPQYANRAKVNVFLTDSPAAYDAVYIDIIQVEIHSDSAGWQSLNPINAGVYNLLDFSNGMDTLLGSVSLPQGKISQIRLILGPNNGILVDSVYHSLTIPSSAQSGLKLNIHDTLLLGMTYNIWIDFDAGRSVIKTGNGNYKLKPVIRTFTDATSGTIKGVISPDTAAYSVMAILGVDTSATMADSTGSFMIMGLAAGTYSVFFNNVNTYNDTTVNPVNVSVGVITDMGSITMTK